MLRPTPPGIVATLLTVIGRIREAVASSVRPSDKRFPRLAAAWLWLETVIDGVARLAARHAAGKLRPLAPRATPRAARPQDSDRRKPLRHTAGWLAREIEDAAPLIAELEATLAHPELAALLAAAPDRAGRLLRPLCRALGLTPPEPIRRPPSHAPRRADPAPATWDDSGALPLRPAHQTLDGLFPKTA